MNHLVLSPSPPKAIGARDVSGIAQAEEFSFELPQRVCELAALDPREHLGRVESVRVIA